MNFSALTFIFVAEILEALAMQSRFAYLSQFQRRPSVVYRADRGWVSNSIRATPRKTPIIGPNPTIDRDPWNENRVTGTWGPRPHSMQGNQGSTNIETVLSGKDWVRNIPTRSQVRNSGHFAGIVPLEYSIGLTAPISRNNRLTFDANSKLSFYAQYNTDTIYIHVLDMSLSPDQISLIERESQVAVPIALVDRDYGAEVLMIVTQSPLKARQFYDLRFGRHSGEIKQAPAMGLFRTFIRQTQTNFEYLVGTQFQLNHARSVFPCIDMPYFKTRLVLAISHPPNTRVIGNMPIEQTQTLSNGWQSTRFEPSPKLPTYTMGFVIVPAFFRQVSATGNGGTVLSLHFNPQQVSVQLAEKLLHYATYSFNYLTLLFAKELGMKKLDFVTIPHHLVQGMENFGMITLSENYVRSAAPSLRLSLIAHEITHMWFSNNVTIKGWDHLCFQEGITDHFARTVVKQYFDGKTDWDNYYQSKYVYAIKEESRLVPPQNLIVDEDPNLNQVSSRCFGKAVFLFESLKALVGSSNFIFKIRQFLQLYQDRLYRIEDFTALFEELLLDGSKPSSEVLLYWFKADGYPSLFVTRDYVQKKIFIQQRHIYPKGDKEPRTFRVLQDTWPVGMKAQIKSSEWESPFILLNQSQSVEVDAPVNQDSWLLFNADFTHFYRINYDSENWKLLVDQMLSNTSQLISDFCFFYRLNLIPNPEPTRSILVRETYNDHDNFPTAQLFLKDCFVT